MRHTLTALSIVLVSAAVSGQANEFMIYPERNGSAATFTTRVSNAKTEHFTEVGPKAFAGVGDGGGGCAVFGLYHWATDENAATRESYKIVFRKPSSTAQGPDPTTAGSIASLGPFQLPTGNGRLGWRMTVTFTRPVVVPCTGGFYYGIELTPANWPRRDGHSIWNAHYNPPANRNIGENARPGAPMHSWSVTGGTVGGPYPWSWRMGILVRTPILNPGGVDPASRRQSPPGSTNWGAGGLYPDITGNPRRDGIDMRIEDRAHPGGVGIVLLGVGFSRVPIRLSAINGRLYLNPALLFPLGFATNSNGIAVIKIAPPRAIVPAFAGSRLFFQGLTLAQGQLTLTNAAVVSL